MKEKRYPKLDNAFLRRAGVIGTPPLTKQIEEKLAKAFVDYCYKNDVDMLNDEFQKSWIGLCVDYVILYGGDDRYRYPSVKTGSSKKTGKSLSFKQRI